MNIYTPTKGILQVKIHYKRNQTQIAMNVVVAVLCICVVKVLMLHLPCGSCGFGTVHFHWLLKFRFGKWTKLESQVEKMKCMSLGGVLSVVPSGLNHNHEA